MISRSQFPLLLLSKMAAQTVEVEPELPEEISESLESFHEALGKIDDVFKPLLETPVDDLKEKVNWKEIIYFCHMSRVDLVF